MKKTKTSKLKTMATSMKNLNCELLELAIQFDEKFFNKKEFKTARKCNDKTHKFFVTHHNSQSSKIDEHAHVALLFDKKDSQLRITLVGERLEDDEETELSDIPLEYSIPEISRFFKKDDFEVNVTAIFKFGKDFESIIKLRYPLLLESGLLQNAVITGHNIKFSNDSMDGNLLITSNKDEFISTLFSAITKVTLSTLNPYIELEKVFSNIQPLITTKRKRRQ